MPEPLLSVVIPVYRVEAFLDRCVQSVCAQSYRRLEIILVDDGSPDACGALCEAWAARDARVRVLHKENGGLSDARNAGVALARGEYIFFLDADDYLAPEALGYLLSLLRGREADIACCALRTVHGGGERFGEQPEERVLVLSAEEAVRALLGVEHGDQLTVACAKLYAARLVRDNPFPLGRLHEDEATTYRYYDQCRGLALSNRELYAYYQNPGSITHTVRRVNQEHKLLAFQEQYRYFAERGETALACAAADRLVNVAVDFAARGDEVYREFCRSGALRPYLSLPLRPKTRLRRWGYALFGIDLNRLYHRLFKP